MLKPNTHCRLDATVELSLVEVLTRRAVCIEFATSSRLANDDCRPVRSHRWHDATRLRCRQMFRLVDSVANYRQLDLFCEFSTHRPRDSTVESRWRRRSYLGITTILCTRSVPFATQVYVPKYIFTNLCPVCHPSLLIQTGLISRLTESFHAIYFRGPTQTSAGVGVFDEVGPWNESSWGLSSCR